MSNVFRLSEAARPGVARPHVGAAFLADPGVSSHAVQFYEEEEFLFDTVGQFLAAGLEAGDRILVIASESHWDGFVKRLGAFDIARAIETGHLTHLDARQMLSRFMVGDMPDPDLFRAVLGRVIAKIKEDGQPQARLRAYGEMVDLLWRDGNSRAAIRLEELWNEAGKEHSFSLLCAYVMGNFYKEGDTARFMEVCKNHGHVLPTESFVWVDDANARLREISLLQQRAHALESEIHHRKKLETALRDALRERARAEEELRDCVQREKKAREQAEASDSFKEMFLGILGHDLRNPLNTVLTTARLMTMRGELPPDSHKRLERVIVSGVRMERMIEQLLDLARARLASGIPVRRDVEQDLGRLTAKIVDEIRTANPLRAIAFRTEGPTTAYVDGDRFEQVASNLVGNAVAHGDAERPIQVVVSARDGAVSLVVHNYGPPINRAFMPMLFDPFARNDRSQGRSDGLGLGLYISDRIVAAHGGAIEVDSTEETGTRFEAIFPRNGDG